MGIVFAVRSDNSNFDARYTTGLKTPYVWGIGTTTDSTPIYAADATAIGGNVFNLDRSANAIKAIEYNCRNLKTTRTISILMRVKFASLGSTQIGMFEMGCGSGGSPAGFMSLSLNATPGLVINARTEVGVTAAAAVVVGNFGATEGVTNSAWLDLVFTWDGTNSANGFKAYVDGVLRRQATLSASMASTIDSKLWNYISIGANKQTAFCRMLVNEVVVWDEVIDPTSNVTLTSGSGLLNGASRTAFVNVSSYEGLNSTDPGVANVRLGTSYVYTGLSRTGTAAIPAAADVRFGTAIDATTGTCYVPTASQTKIGVNVDNTVGTYIASERYNVPTEGDVRSGTAYMDNTVNKTGTLVVPAATDVRDGVSFDSTPQTGSLDLPLENTVQFGTTYDNGTKTGTLQANSINVSGGTVVGQSTVGIVVSGE